MPDFLWKWRREIIFALLVLVSLGMVLSLRQPGIFGRTLRQTVSLVVFPFQKASSSLVRTAQGWVSFFTSLSSLRRENQELSSQVEKLSLRNQLLREQARENEQLRTELEYKRRTEWSFLPAEVIARDPVSWLERVVVDRGSTDGVTAGSGAITPAGVAGRVQDVNPFSATVMLMVDSQSSVAGWVERSKVHGTVKGTGEDTLRMVYVAGGEDVRAGDRVVTSHLSTLFPAGLPIGDVVSVAPAENGLMLDIRLKPCVDFKNQDRFLILLPEN
ncbi:MAG: rod shape-determining protein MreC [candidate division FCPU426 bacterium]